ncbi:MAG TPA: glycosyl transferase, partial [Microbacteriaceae bacterium]|nr:glycosyl transferase [Microbacteriaceae bacterium]
GARVANIAEPLVKYRVGAGAFERRGGFGEAVTELKLQSKLRKMKFITFKEYLRNVVMKGAYRLLPASIKKRLFARLIADGLPGDKV